jgi:putative intracellular protease/amidase
MPLPDRDFDVTEVAVPWKLLTAGGVEVVFATERGGTAPSADPLLLTGVLFGQLGADPEPIAFYRELERDPAFRAPLSWAEIDADSYQGLVLPGGHAKGMRPYLESEVLRGKVLQLWGQARVVGAICHGVIVLARTINPVTGKSVLSGRQTTCLPRYMEQSAWLLTRWKLGDYYRTYPTYVQDEVKAAVGPSGRVDRGPLELRRGTASDDGPAFLVEDGAYVSARWPGDAYRFGKSILTRLA